MFLQVLFCHPWGRFNFLKLFGKLYYAKAVDPPKNFLHEILFFLSLHYHKSDLGFTL